jgi:hypothetical protein
MVVSALAPVYVVPSPPSDYYVYGPAYYEDYYYGPPDGLTDYGPPPRNWHGSSQNPHSKSPSPAPTLELQKQLASPVRSKKSTLSLRRPEQKQNAPGLTRLAKRTLRQLGPAQTNPWILNGARPKRLSVVCDSSRKGGDGHELRPQTKSFS